MGRFSRLVAGGAVIFALAACDTNVTNPGPVQDEFLDREEAHPAIVAGMGRALAEATNWIGYTSAAVAREIHPSGSTGSFGITVRWQRGELNPTDDALNTHWNEAQQARWFAEDGLRRMQESSADPALVNEAFLWAGYANRLLGETFCQSVIDGGSPGPASAFLDRAENWFGQAIATASGDMRTAAYAGRASVRVDKGDWAGAVADAGNVPDGFAWRLPYFDIGEDAQKNRIHFASAALPYKAHTQWNTWVDAYYRATNDPRVPFMETNEVGDAAIDCCGRVPWWPQQKHATSASDIDLSTGDEMRLIEAESMLRDQKVDQAMAKINAVRTAAGVGTLTAADANEAWTHLKRERAIVLWLEGRRLGDLRRWAAQGAPGDLDPLEMPSGDTQVGSHLAQQDLCFPIPPSEQDTNPNVPSS